MSRTSQSSIRRRMRVVCVPDAFAGRALREPSLRANRTGPSPSPRLPRPPQRNAAPQSASPLRARFDIMSPQLTPAFPATQDSNLRKVRKLKPLFSISSAPFDAFAQLTFPRNPFIFFRLRTFSDDHRGWGYPNCPILGFLVCEPLTASSKAHSPRRSPAAGRQAHFASSDLVGKAGARQYTTTAVAKPSART